MKPQRIGWCAVAGASLMLTAGAGRAQTPEFLVGLRPQSSFQGTLSAASFGGQVRGYNASLHAYRLALPINQSPEALARSVTALRQNPQIAYVEPNVKMSAVQAAPPDPSRTDDPFFSQQYALKKIAVSTAWGLWKPTSQTIVAVLDTGVDAKHPDLTNTIYRNAGGEVIGVNLTSTTASTADGNGHGTFCAGEIAAQANNGIGVAGVAGWNNGASTANPLIKIMPVKVLADDGSGYLSWVCDGITWAVNHGAKVISLSLGAPSASETLTAAVNYANSHGCLVLAAAGNDGVSKKFYPAATPGVISVGASSRNDALTSFSNYGDWVKIAAPGDGILSTLPNNQYGTGSGTSMACPMVAAAAAVLRAQFPQMSNDELAACLLKQVDPCTPYNDHTLAVGAGRLNLGKALAAALGTTAPPPPPAVKLTSFTLNAERVIAGVVVIGRVTLSAPAPASGISIALTSDQKSVILASPALTVRAGEKAAQFAFVPAQVTETTTVTLTAANNGVSLKASLKITANQILGFALDPKTISGGQTARAGLTLAAPAPEGGLIVTLKSNNTAAQMPLSVTVPAGQRTLKLEFSTRPVKTLLTVQLTASLNGANKVAELTLKTQK